MEYGLNKIPRTGSPRALFFGHMLLRSARPYIEAELPGETTFLMTRAKMEGNLPAGTEVPETVPMRQPESVYGKSGRTDRIAAVVTDREPEAFMAAVTRIMDDHMGECVRGTADGATSRELPTEVNGHRRA